MALAIPANHRTELDSAESQLAILLDKVREYYAGRGGVDRFPQLLWSHTFIPEASNPSQLDQLDVFPEDRGSGVTWRKAFNALNISLTTNARCRLRIDEYEGPLKTSSRTERGWWAIAQTQMQDATQYQCQWELDPDTNTVTRVGDWTEVE